MNISTHFQRCFAPRTPRNFFTIPLPVVGTGCPHTTPICTTLVRSPLTPPYTTTTSLPVVCPIHTTTHFPPPPRTHTHTTHTRTPHTPLAAYGGMGGCIPPYLWTFSQLPPPPFCQYSEHSASYLPPAFCTMSLPVPTMSLLPCDARVSHKRAWRVGKTADRGAAPRAAFALFASNIIWFATNISDAFSASYCRLSRISASPNARFILRHKRRYAQSCALCVSARLGLRYRLDQARRARMGDSHAAARV